VLRTKISELTQPKVRKVYHFLSSEEIKKHIMDTKLEKLLDKTKAGVKGLSSI
jgi:hypothetical protein